MDKQSFRIILKKSSFIVFVLFILIQFYRPNKNDGEILAATDFLVENPAPKTVEKLLRNACYDCHSEYTAYSWFDNIAPVSWWIDHNIEQGKYNFNFSEWSKFPAWRKLNYLSAIEFDITTNKMPPENYAAFRDNANLSEAEKQLLLDWLANINRKTIKGENIN